MSALPLAAPRSSLTLAAQAAQACAFTNARGQNCATISVHVTALLKASALPTQEPFQFNPAIREQRMSYIYPSASKLEGQAKVGTTECVALVQAYTQAPTTLNWEAGDSVCGNKSILPGTAIATFVNGKYKSHATGNHAAFFLKHTPTGFLVIDQWRDDRPVPENTKPTISSREIRFKQKKPNKDGSWPNASNNAYAYSIIE